MGLESRCASAKLQTKLTDFFRFRLGPRRLKPLFRVSEVGFKRALEGLFRGESKKGECGAWGKVRFGDSNPNYLAGFLRLPMNPTWYSRRTFKLSGGRSSRGVHDNQHVVPKDPKSEPLKPRPKA